MSEKILLTQFEYDYLMAQKAVDTSRLHMEEMIRRGYFSALEKWFVKDERGNRFIQIGTIRDLIDRFEIKGA